MNNLYVGIQVTTDASEESKNLEITQGLKELKYKAEYLFVTEYTIEQSEWLPFTDGLRCVLTLTTEQELIIPL